ncbi:MAG: hypothetical protein FJ296_11300 [Planctomycetes bacterium]|nr:hypothetical protein [Planctomycetota bacterium]
MRAAAPVAAAHPVRTGWPVPRRGGSVALFASSCFSVIAPQGGSQNVIFAASGFLTQRELYRLGLLVTAFFLAVFLLIGTPWLMLVVA